MTDKSINGWSVIDSQTDARLIRRFIPGSKRMLLVHRDAAPVLLWAASRFDQWVADVDPDPLAVWGYNKRKIRIDEKNPNAPWSDHASGTAIDLRSDKFPIGRRNMTAIQRLKCRMILRYAAGLLIWGGNYKNDASADEMHFAIAPGVTPMMITAWRIKNRINQDGTKA